MEERIKELAITNALTDAYLILEEARKIKVSLALELQAAKDDRKSQYKEFQELMVEITDVLTKIQAQFRIEAQLLNLVKPEEVEEDDRINRDQGNGRKFKVTVS